MCLRNFEIYVTSDIVRVGGNGNVSNLCWEMPSLSLGWHDSYADRLFSWLS